MPSSYLGVSLLMKNWTFLLSTFKSRAMALWGIPQMFKAMIALFLSTDSGYAIYLYVSYARRKPLVKRGGCGKLLSIYASFPRSWAGHSTFFSGELCPYQTSQPRSLSDFPSSEGKRCYSADLIETSNSSGFSSNADFLT